MLEDVEKGFDARDGTAAGPVKNPPKDAEAGGITRLGAAAADDTAAGAGAVLVPPKVNPVVPEGVIENPVAPPVAAAGAAAGAPKLNPPGRGVTVDTAVCALEGCIENDPEKSFVGPTWGAVPQGVDVGIGTSAVTVAVFEATGAEPKEKAGMVTVALCTGAAAAAAAVTACPLPFRLLSHDKHLVAVLLFCTKQTAHF